MPPKSPKTGSGADHWHTAFGVNICGEWLRTRHVRDRHRQPNVYVGLNTHATGTIDIHPTTFRAPARHAGCSSSYAGWSLSDLSPRVTGERRPAEKTWVGTPRRVRSARPMPPGRLGRWSVDCRRCRANPADYETPGPPDPGPRIPPRDGPDPRPPERRLPPQDSAEPARSPPGLRTDGQPRPARARRVTPRRRARDPAALDVGRPATPSPAFGPACDDHHAPGVSRATTTSRDMHRFGRRSHSGELTARTSGHPPPRGAPSGRRHAPRAWPRPRRRRVGHGPDDGRRGRGGRRHHGVRTRLAHPPDRSGPRRHPGDRHPRGSPRTRRPPKRGAGPSPPCGSVAAVDVDRRRDGLDARRRPRGGRGRPRDPDRRPHRVARHAPGRRPPRVAVRRHARRNRASAEVRGPRVGRLRGVRLPHERAVGQVLHHSLVPNFSWSRNDLAGALACSARP